MARKSKAKNPISFVHLRKEIDSILAEGVDKHYTQYKMRKKSGGFRVISVPDSRLKTLQRQILAETNKSFTWFASNRSFGFVPRRNIIKGALWHNNFWKYLPVDQTYSFKKYIEKLGNTVFTFTDAPVTCNITHMIRIDLKDAFGSITTEKILERFPVFLDVPTEDKVRISKICTLNGSLPQGAPTSPMLLNMALEAFDNTIAQKLSWYSKSIGAISTFTRYADDITISSNSKSPIWMIRTVEDAAKRYGLTINKKKTRLMTKKTGFFVNGINVINSSSHFSISRRERNKIRAAIHQASTTEDPNIKEELINSIRGRIQYVASVDRVHGTNLMAYAIEKDVLPPDSKINKQTLLIRKLVDKPIKDRRANCFKKRQPIKQ
jgi:hypothetical protein